MFYCNRLQPFQEQIQQQKKKDIWNSDGEDSDSVRSNASNQSQLSAQPQGTTVPLPQNRSRKRPGKSDEIKSK